MLRWLRRAFDRWCCAQCEKFAAEHGLHVHTGPNDPLDVYIETMIQEDTP